MKATMFIAMLFVLTSHLACADEVSKVQIQRTMTLRYEFSGLVLSSELQQNLKSSIISKLEKRNVPKVVVVVGEKSLMLLAKAPNDIFLVHNYCVLRSIYDVLGKEPEVLE